MLPTTKIEGVNLLLLSQKSVQSDCGFSLNARNETGSLLYFSLSALNVHLILTHIGVPCI